MTPGDKAVIRKKTMKALATSFLILLALVGAIRAQDLPQLRAAVLQIGTVNWELETILQNGLDRKHGFELTVLPYADNGATRLAVEGGAADMAFDAYRGTEWMADPCRSCDRKTVDFGGCRCQAMAIVGDAGATDPVCVKSPHHGDRRAGAGDRHRDARSRDPRRGGC